MKVILITSACFLGMTLDSWAQDFVGLPKDPWMGMEFHSRHTGFEKGRGNDLIGAHSPQWTTQMGFKFSNHLGMEAGYSISKTKRRSKFVDPDDAYLGPGIFFYGQDFQSHARSHGLNVSLIGFLECGQRYPVTLIGSVGLSRLQLKVKQQHVTAGIKHDFKATQWVLRHMAGVQSLFTDRWGIRSTVVFEQTSRFKAMAPKRHSRLRIQFKNSTSVGLGVFYRFE